MQQTSMEVQVNLLIPNGQKNRNEPTGERLQMQSATS